MLTDFYNSWHTVYRVTCNISVIDLPNSSTYCCYTTLGNINCCIEQDSAPAHRARQSIEHLQRETPKFIPPDSGLRTVLTLVLLTVEYWAQCRIVCTRCQFET